MPFSLSYKYKALSMKPRHLSYLSRANQLRRQHLSGKKTAEMEENLGFKEESIMVQHTIFALLVNTLINQIKVKYQSMPVSPFETHERVMSAFFVALFIYATASVAEVILRTQKSVHQRLVGNIRLFASALATTLLLTTLALVLACIISVLWTCLSVKLAYESCQDLCQLLRRAADELLERLKGLIAIARSPREKPVGGNTSSPPEKDHAGEDEENNHAGEHQGDNHAICNRPSHERGEEESNKKGRAAEMGGAAERREAVEEDIEMKGLDPRSFLSKPTCTGNKETSACMAEMEERSTYVDGPDETQGTAPDDQRVAKEIRQVSDEQHVAIEINEIGNGTV